MLAPGLAPLGTPSASASRRRGKAGRLRRPLAVAPLRFSRGPRDRRTTGGRGGASGGLGLGAARALAARAELAVAMEDAEAARAARAELQRISLSDENRERFLDELQAAEDLERWLTQGKGDPA